MKKFLILTLLALELAVCGCGNTTPSSTITTETPNSTWEAQLTGGTGPASGLSFTTAFSSSNYSTLDITNFFFINTGPCFGANVGDSTVAGAVTLTTNSTDQVSGSLGFAVTSVTPAGNILTLTSTGLSGTSNGTDLSIGTLSNGVVWGNWTLTGGQGDPGCAGSGNFVMCQGPKTGTYTCTVP